jgi:glyoxylase-like metal-dependent hydrolase (beta-lactamase superfamily II)
VPSLQRRSLLALLACAPWAQAAERIDAVEVEAGVYLLPGKRGAPEIGNLGHIGNAGFIVGRSGVLAIDAGVSRLHGEALLAAIAQVTPLSVKAVLITSTHQEFLFGASAFQARGIPVLMQREAAALMVARCEGCLKTLQRELGDEVMRGTAMFKPDQLFEQTHVIETIGRPVLVQHHGHSSGPGDISVFDVRSGTLFAGSLLAEGRVPDIQDSELEGWHQALNALRTLNINTVVPGHGKASGPELIRTVDVYLQRLERRVAELLDASTALSEVPDAAALPDYKDWDQYDIIHRRNASILFLRLERQLLLQDSGVHR